MGRPLRLAGKGCGTGSQGSGTYYCVLQIPPLLAQLIGSESHQELLRKLSHFQPVTFFKTVKQETKANG